MVIFHSYVSLPDCNHLKLIRKIISQEILLQIRFLDDGLMDFLRQNVIVHCQWLWDSPSKLTMCEKELEVEISISTPFDILTAFIATTSGWWHQIHWLSYPRSVDLLHIHPTVDWQIVKPRSPCWQCSDPGWYPNIYDVYDFKTYHSTQITTMSLYDPLSNYVIQLGNGPCWWIISSPLLNGHFRVRIRLIGGTYHI